MLYLMLRMSETDRMLDADQFEKVSSDAHSGDRV